MPQPLPGGRGLSASALPGTSGRGPPGEPPGTAAPQILSLWRRRKAADSAGATPDTETVLADTQGRSSLSTTCSARRQRGGIRGNGDTGRLRGPGSNLRPSARFPPTKLACRRQGRPTPGALASSRGNQNGNTSISATSLVDELKQSLAPTGHRTRFCPLSFPGRH